MFLWVTMFIQPVLGEFPEKSNRYIVSSISDKGVLLLKNSVSEDFSDTLCFLDTSEKIRWITANREEFLGKGGLEAPEALSREFLSGWVGRGADACGALQVEVVLAPEEEKTIVFLMGAAQSAEQASEISKKYKTVENATAELKRVQEFWKSKLSILQVETPDISMNFMLNGWLQYQVISARLWGRTGFYQSSGAFGFRDQLQDTLSLLNVHPKMARKQILYHAAHQFEEGDVQHWWHEPRGNGVRTKFSDDLLWLPYVAAEYVTVTGDAEVWGEKVPFLQSVPLSEEETDRYETSVLSDERAPLYEHCVRAVEKSLKFGKHGLPLMGGGDWNDGMNTVGDQGKGESVWLGWFLSTVLEKMEAVCIEQQDENRAHRYKTTREQLIADIEANGWDGRWYRRAYFDDGTPLGSIMNEDCKIDSIAQSWSVISGVGNIMRSKQAMESLEEYLISYQSGLIRLLAPPFDKGKSEPGYIKGYFPGVRENGGQYTHAAVWVILAYAKMGQGDKAMELYHMINPINHTDSFRSAMTYKTEPFAVPADVYSVYPHIGRGGWSWYTGAASWMYRAGTENLLGFCKNNNILTINPCIPQQWKHFSIHYNFSDTIYQIKISNPNGLETGKVKFIINGNQTNKILLVDDGKLHQLEGEMV